MFQLPGYDIVERVYQSPTTTIYRGWSQKYEKSVILKTLSSESPAISNITRINHEIEILKTQNFADISSFLEVVYYKHVPILITEDFHGTSLDVLTQSKPMALEFFLKVAIQISEELGRIHKANIIHKDINPSNIVLNLQTNQVQIVDFDTSSLLPRESINFRSPSHIEGTLAYISPEQTGRMNQAIDYRTDFYSLGITFFELLTGQKPFDSQDAMELVHCHIAKTPPSMMALNSEISSTVEAIVMKLLSKTLEERYQSAYGLTKDLERCLDEWQTKHHIEPFSLGEHDLSERFQIPQKLYGRKKEISQLLSTFAQVKLGKSKIMMVTGYSGIGKSALVNEIQKPIVNSRGYFISGKFDQFKRDIPFSAFIQAFQELVQQLLAESDESLKQWKEKILEAVSPNARLLLDVIPELELIIAEQPEVDTLPPMESQNRFQTYFRKFVDVFATKEHPLVIFLDDLQWADSASLNLIKSMITAIGSHHLFMIGAYRNNEVTPAHPLMVTLNSIEKHKGAEPMDLIERVTLKNLSQDHVAQLISETLRRDQNQSSQLAQLITKKTNGNPFFTREFLTSMYRDNLLQFDLNHGYWQWDMQKINQIGFADNVIDLMTQKIGFLAPDTQKVLKLAACVGNQFGLHTLSIAFENSFITTSQALWEALEGGLILPLASNYKYIFHEEPNAAASEKELPYATQIIYKFVHDRVQQAAYKLLTEEEKERTHLQIGQLLLANKAELDIEENIISIANHINLGLSLIQQPEAKLKFAHMNLRAGKKAKGATAYHSAILYFEHGISLLPEDSWDSSYSLTYELYAELLECEYLTGQSEKAEEIVEILLKYVQSNRDLGQIYVLRTMNFVMVGQFVEGIQEGIAGLALFEVDLPFTPEASDIEKEAAEIEQHMQGKELSDLVNMPPLTDAEKLLCMKILSHIWAPSYLIGNPTLLAVIILKMTNIAMKYGDISGIAYSLYALLQVASQNYKTGYEFGQTALKMSPKAVYPVYFLGTVVGPWRTSLSNCIAYLHESYRNCIASGDLILARYTAILIVFHDYFKGEPLEKVNEVIERYFAFIDESGDPMLMLLNRLNPLFTQAMMTNPDPFNNEVFDETVELDKNLHVTHNVYYINKAQIAFMFGDYQTAFDAAHEAEKTLGSTTGYAMHVNRLFYLSLGGIALIETMSSDEIEQKQIWEVLTKNQEQMKLWAENCPDNFLHKYLLVSAEVARISKEDTKAMPLYEEAIERAKENEYLQDIALANELAAKFYLSNKVRFVAKTYMVEARYWYERWGATLKVNQLNETYPELLTHESISVIPRSTSLETYSTSSSNLDLTTVMKASHAISKEIILEQLLDKMVTILIENAGAQSGYLIMMKGDQLFIEAEGNVEQGVKTMQSILVDLEGNTEEPPLPVSILSYVVHTQKELVLEDAIETDPYSHDVYVLNHQPRSVMCVPIFHHGQLSGLIYLENNLTPGAFTQERVDLLELLSGQVAISIENAQLYDNLEEKVAEQTKTIRGVLSELEERHEQLKEALNQLEKMAVLGTLVAGVAHEINNPIGYVHTSAQNLKYQLEQLQQFILQLADEEDEEEGEMIRQMFDPRLKPLFQSVDLIFEGAHRINSIVGDLSSLSRRGEEQQKEVDVVKGLNSTLGLVKTNYRHQIEFVCEYNAKPLIDCWPVKLNQVFMNMMVNACHAMLEGHSSTPDKIVGTLTISTFLEDSWLGIRFQDTGCGIPQEVLEKIFEPFFTTKPEGKGTGLGLSISAGIIKKHNGKIDVESEEGKGTTFTILLPI